MTCRSRRRPKTQEHGVNSIKVLDDPKFGETYCWFLVRDVVLEALGANSSCPHVSYHRCNKSPSQLCPLYSVSPPIDQNTSFSSSCSTQPPIPLAQSDTELTIRTTVPPLDQVGSPHGTSLCRRMTICATRGRMPVLNIPDSGSLEVAHHADGNIAYAESTTGDC